MWLLFLLLLLLLPPHHQARAARLTLCPTPSQQRALDAHHHQKGLFDDALSHADALARFGPTPLARSKARAFLDTHPSVRSVEEHGDFRFEVGLAAGVDVEEFVRKAPPGMFCPRIKPRAPRPTPRYNGVRRGAEGLQPTGQNGPGASPTYAVPSNLGYSAIYNTPNPEAYVRLNYVRSINLVVLELDAPYLASDLLAFSELTGTLEGYGSTRVVNLSASGALSGSAFDEASLDMQTAVSLAPVGATNIIYFGCNNMGGYWEMECFLALLDAWAADGPFDIVSFSWGEYELLDYEPQIFGYYYAQLLAAMGATLFFSSGDNGAPGDRNLDCNLGTAPLLSVQFPSSSPYVTAVGATAFVSPVESDLQYYQSSSPLCNQGANIGAMGTSYGFAHGAYSSNAFFACVSSVSGESAVAAAQQGFSTGGGFSSWFTGPSWQTSAVGAYAALQDSLAFPNASLFDTGMRGVPDISVFGCGTPVVVDGVLYSLGGTSQSAPTAAALWVYVADFMLHQFNVSVGNINPLLYTMWAHPLGNTFSDVVVGNNNGTETVPDCVLGGFPAAAGWDAASGLGSFNVGHMKSWMVNNAALTLAAIGASTGRLGQQPPPPPPTGNTDGSASGGSDSSTLDTLFTAPYLYYSIAVIVVVGAVLLIGLTLFCLRGEQQQQKEVQTQAQARGVRKLPSRRHYRPRSRHPLASSS